MLDPSEMSKKAWTARYPDLDGKTVFISGGATGIGASLVAAYARQGAQVCFIDLNADAGAALVARLQPDAPRAPIFTAADVTDGAALRQAIDAARDVAGRLDVLINNAANDDRHDPARIDEAYWDWNIGVNAKHQFFAAQRAFHWMQPQGSGAIINFSSIAPRLGLPDLPVYNLAKHGVAGLTRTLSAAFGPQGVRVNAIAPGAILTPRQLATWIDPAREAEILAAQHLKRRLVGDDIAPTALFLGSDASNAIAGQTLTVDAGFTTG